jgi:hypothetical protein
MHTLGKVHFRNEFSIDVNLSLYTYISCFSGLSRPMTAAAAAANQFLPPPRCALGAFRDQREHWRSMIPYRKRLAAEKMKDEK